MTINDKQSRREPSVRCGLSALTAIRESLEQKNLDPVSDLSSLLRVLAEPAIKAGAVEAVLDYIDLDKAGKPEWARTVAVWQRPGQSPIPLGVRYYIPEFPCFRLWLSNPQGPQYFTDLRTDERLHKSTRDVFLEMQQRAMVTIPLRHAKRWVGLLFFTWDRPHAFSEYERILYEALATLVPPVIKKCRLLNNMEEKCELCDKVLREAAGRYRELFDISPHGIAFVDLEGQLIECNQAYLDMLGYTSMVEIQHATACCKTQALLIQRHVRKQGSDGKYAADDLQPAEYYRKDGQRIRIPVQTRLSYNKKGKPVGMWITCHIDGADKG